MEDSITIPTSCRIDDVGLTYLILDEKRLPKILHFESDIFRRDLRG